MAKSKKSQQPKSVLPDSFSFDINRHAIIEQAEDQVLAVKLVNDRIAEVRDQIHLLQIEIKIAKAELALDIRDNPDDYDLEKVTDAAVNACVESNEDIANLQKEVQNATYELDILNGTSQALADRRRMLILAKDLLIGGFYASALDAKPTTAKKQVKKKATRRRGTKR